MSTDTTTSTGAINSAINFQNYKTLQDLQSVNLFALSEEQFSEFTKRKKQIISEIELIDTEILNFLYLDRIKELEQEEQKDTAINNSSEISELKEKSVQLLERFYYIYNEHASKLGINKKFETPSDKPTTVSKTSGKQYKVVCNGTAFISGSLNNLLKQLFASDVAKPLLTDYILRKYYAITHDSNGNETNRVSKQATESILDMLGVVDTFQEL